jgi:hypothetical protein
MSILPWRSRRDRPIPDAHRTKTPEQKVAINSILIANDVLRCLWQA